MDMTVMSAVFSFSALIHPFFPRIREIRPEQPLTEYLIEPSRLTIMTVRHDL